jgi:acetaldehyde dehydrogenase (acetylating)
MAEAGFRAAERLGQMAHEETKLGVPNHKTIKNQFASRDVWEYIKDIKTVGVIGRDDARRVVEIAWPFGVIAALVPVTNPTSTVLFKAISALKARSGIVFSPHPSAAKCTAEAARIMAEASVAAGAPPGLVGCLTQSSLAGTQEMMKQKAVHLILATGGESMVHFAYSLGKAAIGVGPGNVPVYVDRSADVAKAARDIVNGASFDWGVVCSHEGAVVVDAPVAAQMAQELERNGAFFLDDTQIALLGKAMLKPDGMMQADFVGRSPQQLAKLVGITVPDDARVLMARLAEVGPQAPLSREKLSPVVAFYSEDGWRRGCERCIEILNFGGLGHTMGLHCRNEDIIIEFGLEKPASRITVNTTTLGGAIGYTSGLPPSLVLGTGGMGGGITSDNITVRHLMNVKRLAYEIHGFDPPKAVAVAKPPAAAAPPKPETDMEALVRKVVEEVLSRKS